MIFLCLLLIEKYRVNTSTVLGTAHDVENTVVVKISSWYVIKTESDDESSILLDCFFFHIGAVVSSHSDGVLPS